MADAKFLMNVNMVIIFYFVFTVYYCSLVEVSTEIQPQQQCNNCFPSNNQHNCFSLYCVFFHRFKQQL